MNKRGILYTISNILYIGSVVACIILWPNMIKTGSFGMLFMSSYLVYSICLFIFYVKKNEQKNKDFLYNLVSIFLYLYLMLIAYKYLASVNDTTYAIDIIYFKMNYIIASVSIMAIIFNKFINKYI